MSQFNEHVLVFEHICKHGYGEELVHNHLLGRIIEEHQCAYDEE